MKAEIKAVKGLCPTESAWWNRILFPPRDSVKNSPVWGIKEQTDFTPRKEKKNKSVLLHFSRSAHSSKPCSLPLHQQDQPRLAWWNNHGRVHESRPAAGSCPSLTPAPKQGWTDERTGGLKGQGKGSLEQVYLSTNGNSDLDGASDWQINQH